MPFRALAVLAGLASAVVVPPAVHAATHPAQVMVAPFSSEHGPYLSTIDDGQTYMEMLYELAPIDDAMMTLPFMRATAAAPAVPSVA